MSTADGSFLAAVNGVCNMSPESFVVLLCHSCRVEPALDAALHAALQTPDADRWLVLFPTLAPFLPTTFHILDAIGGMAYVPCVRFADANTQDALAAICRGESGSWTFGWLQPHIVTNVAPASDLGMPLQAVAASTEPMLPLDAAFATLMHHVPSFLGSLGCLTPLSFQTVLDALVTAGVQHSLCASPQLCQLFQLLECHFSPGLRIRTATSSQVWRLNSFGACHAEDSESGTDAPYLCLRRDECGFYLPVLRFPAWLGELQISCCWLAINNPCLLQEIPGNCFFEALGIDRTLLLTSALQAATMLSFDGAHHVLLRLTALLQPGKWVNAMDIQIFVNLLPHWFPGGVLLFSDEGILLHFECMATPCSILPEDLWLQ